MLWVTGTPADSRTTSNNNLTVRVDRDLLIQTHYRKMLSPLMATPTTQEQIDEETENKAYTAMVCCHDKLITLLSAADTVYVWKTSSGK